MTYGALGVAMPETTSELRERVAVLERQVEDSRHEIERARQRLHELESDRALLKIVVDQMKTLTDQLPRIAEEAANRALQQWEDNREDVGLRRLALRAQWISVGIAFGGFGVSLSLLLVKAF